MTESCDMMYKYIIQCTVSAKLLPTYDAIVMEERYNYKNCMLLLLLVLAKLQLVQNSSKLEHNYNDIHIVNVQILI